MKNNLFSTLLLFFRKVIYSSLFFIDSLLKRRGLIIILSYHSIENSNNRYSINKEVFKDQINFLLKHYIPITLNDLYSFIKGDIDIDKPSFIVTFDDGYKNLIAISDFLFKKKIYPTAFLLSDEKNVNRIELDNYLPFLSDQDIQKLLIKGWILGSHSATHPDFNKISNKTMYTEIVDSKHTLANKYKSTIKYFAYPKGKYSQEIISIVEKYYSIALTMDDCIINRQTDRFLIPRVGIDRTHSFIEFKSSFSPSVVELRRLIKKFVPGGVVL